MLSKHLGEPEVCSGKNSENARHCHDQMKMGDNKISVMQVDVQRRLGKQRSGQSAGNEKDTKPIENNMGVVNRILPP